ncbi:MAG: amidase [Rhodospirillales bacterium]
MDGHLKTPYDPRTFRALTWHDHAQAFADGSDSPRAYLERCLETIDAREPVVKAFPSINKDGARAAADAATARWRAEAPLSPIDGLPIAIKDLLETRDMPTQMGSAAFTGAFPKRDNAAVWALRKAGAVVLAKTVTAELGGTHPGPTTNPFDPARTPGGSSSGSAAAVAARMVPAAIGTQVGGSIIRPAAYCGNVALKPSQGAINRGERMSTSMSTHGPHAGCIEDMWQVAIEIAKRAGGDRDYRALKGPDTAPEAARPGRLMVLETAGWERVDAATKAAFADLLGRLKASGVELVDRRGDAGVEAFEKVILDAEEIATDVTLWENRWGWRNMVDEHGDKISHRLRKGLEKAEAMAPADYEALLDRRAAAQAAHQSAAILADCAITLSCPGPAPLWDASAADADAVRRPTGDAIFNYPSSMLFAPVVTIPMMAVGGMPVGMQLMGRPGDDAKITGLARWILENVAPAVSD